ncbi:MAG TPA: serine hydrolase domain-containing protein, partial [Gemmatimonadales bacterium]
MRLARLTAMLLVLAGPVEAQGRRTADAWSGFDAYVAAAVKGWRVPGLAIAVVRGDSVVFARGYGVRTAGGSDSVTAHTLFANASTTKAFTAMAAAMMVDAGKLSWSDRVADLLPDFRLADPAASRELTLRDLLSHHTGFPDPEYLWYGRSDSMTEIFRRMRFVRPAPGLRTGYAYNNGTYALAGYLTGRAAGTSWDEVIRTRILVPLGMTAETVALTAGLSGRNDVAMPHEIIDDTVRTIDRLDLDNIAPAGSMLSSVLDMSRWIRFLLAGGRTPDGTRLVSEASFAELFKPQVLIPGASFYPTSRLTRPHFTAYGMGWFLQDYRGEFAAFHTGSIDGMTALVGLLPERKVGMVVFANLDHAELRHAL